MKKILCFALAAVSLFAAGCSENGGNDDGYRRLTLKFEGDEWNSKVDVPQYMGPKLYGDGYSWYDSTTDLYSEFTNSYGDNKFWGGGIAVSNYYSIDAGSNNTFDQQLTVYADGAKSGSNFLVCNGFKSSYGDSRPFIEFKYGKGYIESMYVCQTTYSFYVAKYGNDYTAKLGDDDWMKIVATGYTKGGSGEEIEGSSVEQYIFRNGTFVLNGWTKWDLSELGEIWKVKFDMQWSGGADAFTIPAYFAIDDITVYKK